MTGCPDSGELLALKRVVVRTVTETTLTFYTDDLDSEPGPTSLALYLISDSYLGLDQQYTIPILLDARCGAGCSSLSVSLL
jgi:hypothetical protein